MISLVRISSCTAFAVLSVFLSASVNAGIIDGFHGIYAPANWTSFTDGDSIINTSGAPTSISMTSSNHLGDNAPPPGVFSITTFSIVLAYSGTIEFRWDYDTNDIDGAEFDPFGYFLFDPVPPPMIPDDFEPPLTMAGFGLQGADAGPIAVMAGQTFGFYMTSDGRGGSATTTITLFSAPGPANTTVVPEPATASLLGIAVLTGAFWQFSRRRRSATTA